MYFLNPQMYPSPTIILFMFFIINLLLTMSIIYFMKFPNLNKQSMETSILPFKW